MATNNTQPNSMPTPTPPQEQQPSPLSNSNTSPPPHPPLQYDDPQRFRDYAHSINFDEDDDFSIDDMFANPVPLPQHEVSSIILAAERFTQQRAQNYTPAQNYPPARGTGLGKTESRPPKRVRVDTPQAGREERGGCAGEEKVSLDGDGGRGRKRVRFDVASADGEEGDGGSVRESLEGGAVRPESSTDKETPQGEDSDDEGNSSDDCAWSVDSGTRGGEEGERAEDGDASCDQEKSIVEDREQQRVETADLPRRS